MENLKQILESLYELQQYDTAIGKLKKQIQTAPLEIEKKKLELENKKVETETIKKNYVSLNSLKKEKEALLATKEEAINKRSVELNSVKSNDAYKAILLDIEKAKADKELIEDQILESMMKIDEEIIVIKSAEKDLKDFEIKVKNEIAQIEQVTQTQQKEVSNIEMSREEQKKLIDKTFIDQYERIREGRGGQGICLVEKDACSACGTMLRPQLLNQIQKCAEIVFCDGCSRILLKK
ncbi:MAG: C4-type zinc ribbon domain-containing protein [Elusimicrobiota bacterium]|jgi:predicted  nucleic acid-binding Zn-ribbon protein|nr:C4-type zinc ribbon domain-containing protein [Elusimicrobiota bacterium]